MEVKNKTNAKIDEEQLDKVSGGNLEPFCTEENFNAETKNPSSDTVSPIPRIEDSISNLK